MKIIERPQVEEWIDSLRSGLRDLLKDELADSAMIGIKSGGATLGEILHKDFALEIPFGQLNISFYRDDFSRIGLHPVVEASDIPFEVEDQQIILVDDVLGTGRTIRAAMNEIFDYGRPKRIILAVLVDRAGRELPVQADVLGERMELRNDQQLKLDTEGMTFRILET